MLLQLVKDADSMCKVCIATRWAGLMKCAAGYERQRLEGWVRVQTARVAEFRKPCLCSFSAAFAPANWHHNLHAFFMTCVGWQALSASLSLLLDSRLHNNTQTESHTPHRAVFHSQLSYLLKPSKTISLTNSLSNSEWRFILRRQPRQKRYWSGWKRGENEWINLKRGSAKHGIWHLAYR